MYFAFPMSIQSSGIYNQERLHNECAQDQVIVINNSVQIRVIVVGFVKISKILYYVIDDSQHHGKESKYRDTLAQKRCRST